MKPVIFLDIDGVINPYGARKQSLKTQPGLAAKLAREKNWPGIEKLGDRMVSQFVGGFDAQAVDYIRRLQQEFDANIVITSSWRVYYDFETLTSIFKIFDISIHDLLPMGFPRSDIIQAYVANHHLDHWIAIDDMDMEKPLAGHYIRTDNAMNEKDYHKARRRITV